MKKIDAKNICDSSKLQIVVYAIIAAFMFYIISCFPFTADDLLFTKVDDIFPWLFSYGNGRYLGNFFSCFSVLYPLFNYILKFLCLFGIIAGLKKYFKFGFKETLILITIILFPSFKTFAQSYTWTAGFSNYVIPITLWTGQIILWKKYREVGKIKWYEVGLLFVLGIAAQLFSENTTVVNFFFVFAVVLEDIIKKRKTTLTSILYTVATGIGCFLIFISPKLLGVADKMDNYRKVGLSGFKTLIKMVFLNFRTISDVFIENFFLLALLSFVIILFFKKRNIHSRLSFFVKAILTFTPAYGMLTALLIQEWCGGAYIKILLNMALFSAYIISVAISLYVLKADNETWLYFGLGIVSIAVLLIVSPIGPRTLYVTYICFAIAAFRLLKAGTKENIFENLKINWNCVVGFLIILMLVMSFTFYDIHNVDNQRRVYIEQKLEEKADEITIPYLPHQEWMHLDYIVKFWENTYYIEKPGDVKYNMVPYQNWLIEKNDE